MSKNHKLIPLLIVILISMNVFLLLGNSQWQFISSAIIPNSQSVPILTNNANTIIFTHFENNWNDSAHGFSPVISAPGATFSQSNAIAGNYSVHLSPTDYMYWNYGGAPLSAGTIEVTVNLTSLANGFLVTSMDTRASAGFFQLQIINSYLIFYESNSTTWLPALNDTPPCN